MLVTKLQQWADRIDSLADRVRELATGLDSLARLEKRVARIEAHVDGQEINRRLDANDRDLETLRQIIRILTDEALKAQGLTGLGNAQFVPLDQIVAMLSGNTFRAMRKWPNGSEEPLRGEPSGG